MKITLVIKSLTGGGAEKVLVLLAAGFQNKGHEVSIVTMSGEQTDAYTLAPGIHRDDIQHLINTSSPIIKNWTLIRALRSAIKLTTPDVVISFVHMVNIRTIISLYGANIPVIVSEHTDPHLAKLSFFWKSLRRLLYPLAKKLVCVSQGVATGFHWSKNLNVI